VKEVRLGSSGLRVSQIDTDDLYSDGLSCSPRGRARCQPTGRADR
jgi:hypothetical protein